MMVNLSSVNYLAIHPLLIVRNPRTHRAALAKDTSACGSLSIMRIVKCSRLQCARNEMRLVRMPGGGGNSTIDLSEVGWEDSGLFLASGIENSFGPMWTS